MAPSPSQKNALPKLRNPLLGGHRKKEAHKFQFDLTIHRVVGGSETEYSIKWCRGVKSTSTALFTAEPKSERGVTIGEKLSLLCTLYRTKATDAREFSAKDSKICLVSYKDGHKYGKTTGKMHFDLSDFSGVPSATTPYVFEVNEKTEIHATITCTFIRISNGTASSAGSGVSGLTNSSGEAEEETGCKRPEASVPEQANNYASGSSIEVVNANIPSAESKAFPIGSGKDFAIRRQDSTVGKKSNSRVSLISRAPVSSEIIRVYAAKSSQFSAGSSDPGTDSQPASTGLRGLPGSLDSLDNAPPERVSGKPSKANSRLGASENDIERLQRELSEARKDTKKSRALHQKSEETVRALRKIVERSDNFQAPPGESGVEEELQRLKRKIAADLIDSRRMKEQYESRISALDSQRDTQHQIGQEQVGGISDRGQSTSAAEGLNSTPLESGGKLEAEVSRLRESNKKMGAELDANQVLVRTLESGCSEMQTETNQLYAKLHAHEEHANQVRTTYEELSQMYSDLSDQNAKLSADLAAARLTPSSHIRDHSLPRAGPKARKLYRKTSKSHGKFSGELAKVAERDEIDQEKNSLQAELLDMKRQHVESDRARDEAENNVSKLQIDLTETHNKVSFLEKEVQELNRGRQKAEKKHFRISKQHDDAFRNLNEKDVAVENMEEEHKKELKSGKAENGEAILKLKQGTVDLSSAIAVSRSDGDTKGQLQREIDVDLAKLESQHKKERQKVKGEKEDAIQKLKQVSTDAANVVTTFQSDEDTRKQLKRENDAVLEKLERQHKEELRSLKAEREDAIRKLKQALLDSANAVTTSQSDGDTRKQLQSENDVALAKLKRQHKEELQSVKAEKEDVIRKLKQALLDSANAVTISHGDGDSRKQFQSENEAELANLKQQHKKELQSVEAEKEYEIRKLKQASLDAATVGTISQSEKDMREQLQKESDAALEKLERQHRKELQGIKAENAEEIRRLKKDALNAANETVPQSDGDTRNRFQSENDTAVAKMEKRHKKELQSVKAENADKIRNLKQALVDAATAVAASTGDEDSRSQVQSLEEALDDARKREDQYEEEVLNMTEIMNSLSSKLKELQGQAKTKDPFSELFLGNSNGDIDLRGASAAEIIASEIEDDVSVENFRTLMMSCPKCAEHECQLDFEKTGREISGKGGQGRHSLVQDEVNQFYGVNGTGKQENSETAGAGIFTSGGSLRKMNMFEHVTEGRLLSMLVETKMKLAILEEDKVSVIQEVLLFCPRKSSSSSSFQTNTD